MLYGSFRYPRYVKNYPFAGVIGPSSVGKSATIGLMEMVFGAKSVVQTKCRARREGEANSNYRFVTSREMFDYLADKSNIVSCYVNLGKGGNKGALHSTEDYSHIYELVTVFLASDIIEAVDHSLENGSILLVELSQEDSASWKRHFPGTYLFRLRTRPDIILERHWKKYPDPDDEFSVTRLISALQESTSAAEKLLRLSHDHLWSNTESDLNDNATHINYVLRDLLNSFIRSIRG